MIATSILPVRSSSSASGGWVSVRPICRPGCLSVSAATARGTSEPITEEKLARRTRPAVSPTCAASSASADVEPPDDLGCPVGQQLSGGGEPDAAPGALQQLRAGLGLEPGEVVADRRLRVVELLRCRGDRAESREGVEDAQSSDVQHLSSLSMGGREGWHWTNESIRSTLRGMTTTPARPVHRLTDLIEGVRAARSRVSTSVPATYEN